MKKRIDPFEYAQLITETLGKGILLNTSNEKFNSMVIGWGHLGIVWGLKTFTVYVRQTRYTKAQLDETGEFTISIPLDGIPDPEITRICGTLSGRDIDKAEHLTLVEPETIKTPGVREYPLTLECEVVYQQDQIPAEIVPEVRDRIYREEGDFHTMYIGRIVDAYIITEE